jgi:hypothetical protein
MSYHTLSGLGMALEASGQMRVGLTRDRCDLLPPPAPLSGLGAGIAFPTITVPGSGDLVGQLVAGLQAPLNAAVDQALDRAAARLPEMQAYRTARNALLGLLAVQALLILGGMYAIERDFGRR